MRSFCSPRQSDRGAVRPWISSTLAALIVTPLCIWAATPTWWGERGVINPTAPAEDYAPVNQGQAKHIATQAYHEFQRRFPGGAGETLTDLANEWNTPSSDDYVVLNIGQLKNLVKPFYDYLADWGYDGAPLSSGLIYPWEESVAADDYAVANIGQTKHLFSFDLSTFGPTVDSDDDGLSDEWELDNFYSLDEDSHADFDGDGLTNLEEFALDTDPTRADSDEDGISDLFDATPWDFFNGVTPIVSISGDAQMASPGQFNAEPFELLITTPAGEPFRNAPVYAYPINGGTLAKSTTPEATIYHSLTLKTDQDGVVRFWFKHPVGNGVNSHIQVYVGDIAPILSASSLLPDSDGDGLPDIYELGENYTGEPGTYPSSPTQFSSNGGRIPDAWIFAHGYSLSECADTDDPDDDGLDNYAEYLQGTDPNDPDSNQDGIPDGGSAPRRIMLRLPFKYGYAYAPGAGVVFFSDGGYWKRWRAGVIEQLAQVSSSPYVSDSTGKETMTSDVHVFGANGDAVLGRSITERWQNRGNLLQRYETTSTEIKNWLNNGQVRDVNIPRFTGHTDFGVIDGDLNWDTANMHSASIDYSGTLWMETIVGLDPYTLYGLDLGVMRIYGLVGLKADGTTVSTNFKGPHSFRGINRNGIYIGSVQSSGPVAPDDYYVGTTKVSYDPLWINDANSVLADDGIHYANGTIDPLSITPFPTWLDSQDRPRGSANGRQVVWRKKASSPGAYHKLFYSPVMLPDGWVTTHQIAPHETEIQLGQATKNDITTAFLLLPGGLRVDADRDGVITDLPSDITSEQQPFRFWINDDNDTGPAAGDNMPSQPSNKADYNNTTVDSIRDLVDFFPVYLDIKQLLTVLPHTTAGITYKLKQTDGALNFVYTNKTRAQALEHHTKILTTGFGPSLIQAAAEATTQQITAAGVDLAEFGFAFLDGIKNNDWGVILVEGRAATTAPLRLVVEKGGVEIAEVALNIKISPVEQMFRHVNLTDQVEEYATYGTGSYITPPRPGLTTNTAQPTNYLDSLSNGKYFVFIHGFNVDADSARGWNAEVFKRMHTMGSKARFVGVQWNGSPPSNIPNKYLDYHKAVFQAFQSGDLLAGELNFTNGADVTVAAHSLGNIVTSHAIQNGGFTPTRYYMINAASPIEAYSLSDAAGQFAVMRHEHWVPYETGLYASKWHELFASTPGDNRNAFTWKTRFENIILTSGLAHNFFSGEEDVVGDADQIDDASILETVLNGNLPTVMTGEYSWKLQELVKGARVLSSAAAAVFERRQGGWGFSTEWNTLVDIQPGPGTNWQSHRRQPNDTGSIPADGLKNDPFFRRFLESDLMSASATTASNKAGENKVKYDVLARAIPAMSNAVAANRLDSLGDNNYDMPDKAKKNGWYDAGNRWRHSDFCYVALPYVYPMFQEMIFRGGLNQ